MSIDKGVLEQLAKVLQEQYGFATSRELNLAVTDINKRAQQNLQRGNHFSFSRMVRGLMAQQGKCLNEQTREQDITFTRALSPATGAGSYLVPTIQANEIISLLSVGSTLRAAGCRVWDMSGVQAMNVPVAAAAPSFAFIGPNSTTTPTDPDFSQMSFNLKEERALVVFPNALLRVSVPAFDVLLGDLLAQGAAEHEDLAFLGTSALTNGPTPLYEIGGTSSLMVGGSASGGNISYGDIVNTIAKAASVKAKPPFIWVCGVRTFFNRLLGLMDTSSRPLLVPTLQTGLQGAIVYSLFGWPVYVSPNVAEDITNSNGSAQSWLLLTSKNYIHIGEDTSQLSVAISTERYFELAQTGIRMVRYYDLAAAPKLGLVFLKGIN